MNPRQGTETEFDSVKNLFNRRSSPKKMNPRQGTETNGGAEIRVGWQIATPKKMNPRQGTETNQVTETVGRLGERATLRRCSEKDESPSGD